MTKEYIEREAAIRALQPTHAPAINEVLASVLRRVPAADVVDVRHGRWINGRCSECGEHAPFWAMATTYHLSKYCHGCGARCDL